MITPISFMPCEHQRRSTTQSLLNIGGSFVMIIKVVVFQNAYDASTIKQKLRMEGIQTTTYNAGFLLFLIFLFYFIIFNYLCCFRKIVKLP